MSALSDAWLELLLGGSRDFLLSDLAMFAASDADPSAVWPLLLPASEACSRSGSHAKPKSDPLCLV